MKRPAVLSAIEKRVRLKRPSYWILLDPDDFSLPQAAALAAAAEKAGGIDAVLVGGSLLHTGAFNAFVKALRSAASIPVILFPGDATQLSRHAHALLYLSLVSGRNPVFLIGEHVKAAPLIRRLGIDPLPTAYLLVESGAVTSVQSASKTTPLPRNKPCLAAAHALAAQYMGMKLVYLEAGSGAPCTVPLAIIRKVRSSIDIPLIVGGGIRDAKTTKKILAAGADVIVTGNMLRKSGGEETMREIAETVRKFKRKN